MTDIRKLVRLSGLTLVVAGVLYVSLLLIPSYSAMGDIGSTSWWIGYYAGTIHHFFLLFGLFGLFVIQRREAGPLGVVAFTVTSLGNAWVGGIGIVQLTILPVFAANPDTQSALICLPFYEPATQAASGFIDAACEAWNFDVLGLWFGLSWLTLMLGSIALGIAIVRAKVFAMPAGALLVVGWLSILAGLLLPIPELILEVALALVGAAYIWCGWTLWTEQTRGVPG